MSSPNRCSSHAASTPILPRSNVWSEVLWYITTRRAAARNLLTGDGAQSHVLWHLLKCGYGNSQHIQENPEDYYTSFHAPNVRRKIFKMYRDLNRRYGRSGAGFEKPIRLDLQEWYLVNRASNPSEMDAQSARETLVIFRRFYLRYYVARAGL